MSRRKTEAWLVELQRGRRIVAFTKQDAVFEGNRSDAVVVTPLVRRDPKAEAVVRAAEKLVRWWEEMGTACNPGSLNADPADRMMGAVDALWVSRKKAKKR